MNHRFGSTDAADSAGVPWAGRSFQPNPAAGDDGRADPGLAAALAAFGAGEAGPEAVVEALRGARLLVPLLAETGDVGLAPDGHRVDKTQELSLVTVAGPDGRPVLPAFTSVDAMRAWHPEARPVPAEASRVALAAGSDGSLVVLDPVSPTEFALRAPALAAIATGEAWLPPWTDPAVVAAFAASVEPEAAVLALDLLPGDPLARLAGPELLVRLGLAPGLDAPALEALLGRVQAAWQASEAIASRVDSLRIAVVAA